jgi:hypothetical protein
MQLHTTKHNATPHAVLRVMISMLAEPVDQVSMRKVQIMEPIFQCVAAAASASRQALRSSQELQYTMVLSMRPKC